MSTAISRAVEMCFGLTSEGHEGFWIVHVPETGVLLSNNLQIPNTDKPTMTHRRYPTGMNHLSLTQNITVYMLTKIGVRRPSLVGARP